MKIRAKIFRNMLKVSIFSILAVSLCSILPVLRTKKELQNTRRAETQQLLESNGKVMTDTARKNIKEYAVAYTEHLESRLEDMESDLQVLGSFLTDLYQDRGKEESGFSPTGLELQPGVSYESVEAECRQIGSIQNLMEHMKEAGGGTFYYVSESGMQLSNERVSGQETVDKRTRDWYQEAKKRGTLTWTAPYADIETGVMTVTCALPLYVEGVCKGVLAEDFTIDALCDKFLTNQYDVFQDIILLSDAGVYMTGTCRMQGSGLEEYAAGITKDKDIQVDFLPEKHLIIGHSSVANTNWELLLVMNDAAILEPIENLGNAISESQESFLEGLSTSIKVTLCFMGVLAAAVFLLAAVITRKLAAYIVRPIEELTQNITAMGNGEEVPPLKVHGEGEIKELEEAFRKMRVDLKAYIENLTRMTAEKERIGAELKVATRIQVHMLPGTFPAFPDRCEFDLFASMTPAKEVGGDFYDFFLVDTNHLAIVIGDVSGKGIPAALFMVICKTMIKNFTMAGLSPEEVFTKVNRELCEENEARMFTTAWLGILEINTGRLSFTEAGHENPLVKKKDGRVEVLKPSEKRLFLAGMEDTRYVLSETILEKGDLLLLYTDGITEACNEKEEFYGFLKMKQLVSRENFKNPKEAVETLKKDAAKFSLKAPQFDDMTLLALWIKV